MIGAKNKTINITQNSASNKVAKKIAKSADLIADNNFVTNNNQLDSILNNKTYSTDKLETSTNYGLSKNDSLSSILASSKK